MGDVNEVIAILIDHYNSIFDDIEEKCNNNKDALISSQDTKSLQPNLDKLISSGVGINPEHEAKKLRKELELKEAMPGSIVREGWLEKKGKSRSKWKLRFFVLKYKFLIYYAEVKDPKPLGRLKLVNTKVELSPKQKATVNPYCFSINTEGRVYFVATRTEEDRNEWIAAIKSCVEGNIENTSTTAEPEPLSPRGRQRHLVITKPPEVPIDSANGIEETQEVVVEKQKEKPSVPPKEAREGLTLSRESTTPEKSDSPTTNSWLSVRTTTPGTQRDANNLKGADSRAAPKKALPPAPGKSVRIIPTIKNPNAPEVPKKTPWTHAQVTPNQNEEKHISEEKHA